MTDEKTNQSLTNMEQKNYTYALQMTEKQAKVLSYACDRLARLIQGQDWTYQELMEEAWEKRCKKATGKIMDKVCDTCLYGIRVEDNKLGCRYPGICHTPDGDKTAWTPKKHSARHTVRHSSMYSPSTLGRPPRKREVTYNGRRIPSNESRKRAACYNSKNDVIWQISTVASL